MEVMHKFMSNNIMATPQLRRPDIPLITHESSSLSYPSSILGTPIRNKQYYKKPQIESNEMLQAIQEIEQTSKINSSNHDNSTERNVTEDT